MKLIDAKLAMDTKTFEPTLTMTVELNIEHLQDSVALLAPYERTQIAGQLFIELTEEALKLARSSK